jgi:uncharacterized protein YbaR (Trm112 family)
MRRSLLTLLRCPYCATPLALGDWVQVREGDSIRFGVLTCECCTWPVVDGIPRLRLDAATGPVLKAVESGRFDEALLTALAAGAGQHGDVERVVARRADITFREAVSAFLPGDEGVYTLHRFSDPTFLTAASVARAVTVARASTRPVLEVGGGCGQLARVIAATARHQGGPPPILTDGEFWRVWLASLIVAPGADALCCDANVPLPVAAAAMSVVVCNDAFHYIWSKRLLADEMTRAAGDAGLVVVTHVHSALGQNAAAGNTLTPAAYARLFEARQVRLFREDPWIDAVVDGRVIDLGTTETPSCCGSAPAIALVAAPRRETIALRCPTTHTAVHDDGVWAISPLYRPSPQGAHAVLTLEFPTDAYAEEFAAIRRYLPERLELPATLVADPARAAAERPDLARSHVLLRLPQRYL